MRQTKTLKIASEIKLLGDTFKIKFVKNLKSGGKEAKGVIYYQDKVIALNEDTATMEVLFHELSHFYARATCVRQMIFSSEDFAEITAMFWNQVFNQIIFWKQTPLKNEIKTTEKKVKAKKKK